MSLQTKVFAAIVLVMTLLGSTQSGSPFKNRTKSEEKPLQNTEPPQITTTSINRTNETLIKNTTPTIQLVHARTGAENVTSTTTLHTKEKVTSRPTQRHVGESDKTSTSPHAGMAQSGGTHITALSVSLALVVCLSAVGVVAAVFFVRWKKIKKMKEGFQEEMATICLHDELASEALYSSWKPFMDTSDSNRMKLVIEPSNINQDAHNTQAAA